MIDLSHTVHGIVALNNHGVTLMEQGRFNLATLTFHDALVCLKEAINSLDPIVNDQSPSQLEKNDHDTCNIHDGKNMNNISSKLQLALTRTLQILSPTDVDEVSKHLKLNSVTHSKQGVIGFCEDYNEVTNVLNDELDDEQDVQMKKKSFFVVRIEYDDFSDDRDTSEEAFLDLETSIILYNIGISETCKAILSSSSLDDVNNSISKSILMNRHSRIGFYRAQRYFELSQSLLQDLVCNRHTFVGASLDGEENEMKEEQRNDPNFMDIIAYGSIVTIETIALMSLIFVHNILQSNSDVILERLDGLKELRITIEDKLFYHFNQVMSSAAAAA